jgi:tetratricopeptide (TPR) repeat protein
MLGGVHMYLTEYSNAKSCYKSAIELGEELGETSEVVQSLNNLGLIEMEQHNPAEAARFFRMAKDRLDNKTDREFGATIRKNLKIAESTIE